MKTNSTRSSTNDTRRFLAARQATILCASKPDCCCRRVGRPLASLMGAVLLALTALSAESHAATVMFNLQGTWTPHASFTGATGIWSLEIYGDNGSSAPFANQTYALSGTQGTSSILGLKFTSGTYVLDTSWANQAGRDQGFFNTDATGRLVDPVGDTFGFFLAPGGDGLVGGVSPIVTPYNLGGIVVTNSTGASQNIAITTNNPGVAWPVPEPSRALLLLGGFGMTMMGRRRR